MIDNPLTYPEPSLIEHAEDLVAASIMTPQEYVGNIMELCQDRRGELKDWLSGHGQGGASLSSALK
jgi:GTP-binding protein LepA